MNAHSLAPEEHFIQKEPYYESVGNEIAIFEAAYKHKLPVLLKGPTGCGKTRFMEYMAWRLKRPMITVSCHDDLTASDLVGRYLVKGGDNDPAKIPGNRCVWDAGGQVVVLDYIEGCSTTSTIARILTRP
jgi:nitric oxide reductase NorQ protein